MKHIDSLPTVAATAFLCVAWTTAGNDKKGMELLAENATMALRLHLYDVSLDIPQSPLDLQDEHVATTAAATA